MDYVRTNVPVTNLPQADLKALLEGHAPNFLKVVARCAESGAPLLLKIEAFHTQPDLLVVARRYATMNGGHRDLHGKPRRDWDRGRLMAKRRGLGIETVLAALPRGSDFTAAELAARLRCQPASVYYHSDRLQDLDVIEYVGRSIWESIPTRGQLASFFRIRGSVKHGRRLRHPVERGGS